MKYTKTILFASLLGLAGLVGIANINEVATASSNKKIYKTSYRAYFGKHKGKNKLQELVNNGTITAEQKLLIEQKMTDMKEAKKTHKEALKEILKVNGLDESYLKFIYKPTVSAEQLQAKVDAGQLTANKMQWILRRQSIWQSKLQSLVEQGQITPAQKTLIEDKQKEVATTRKAARSDLKAWAEANGIDLKDIKLSKFSKKHLKFKGGKRFNHIYQK